jgi:hypothetical protein
MNRTGKSNFTGNRELRLSRIEIDDENGLSELGQHPVDEEAHERRFSDTFAAGNEDARSDVA